MAARPDRRGVSLFELVMVILIVGVGVVPVLAAFRDAAQKSPISEQQTCAALLAVERMEQVMRDRAEPARGYAWIAQANYPAESPVSGFAGFARTTTVEPDTTIDAVTVRRVKVAVANAGAPPVVLRTWFTGVSP